VTSTKAVAVVNVLKVVVGVCVIAVVFGALHVKTQNAHRADAQDRILDAWRQRAVEGQPPTPGIAVKDGVLYLACDGEVQALDARTLAKLDRPKTDVRRVPAEGATPEKQPTKDRAQPR